MPVTTPRPTCTRSHCVSVQDYVACVLCGPGTRPGMEPTVADSWGLYNADARAWYTAAVAACGIPLALLPDIVTHDHVVRR